VWFVPEGGAVADFAHLIGRGTLKTFRCDRWHAFWCPTRVCLNVIKLD